MITVRPTIGELTNESEHRMRGFRVQTGGGLIEDEEVGIAHQGPGQRQAGLHARGVATDRLVECAIDAEPGRSIPCLRIHVAVQLVQGGGIAKIVPPGEPVVEGRLGRHDATPLPHTGGFREWVDAERANRPRVEGERTGDHPDGGGLACAVGPHDHRDLAGWRVQVEFRQCGATPEPSARAGERDGGGPIGPSDLRWVGGHGT